MITAGLAILASGFALLALVGAVRACLPEMIIEKGRDPSERRYEAMVRLRVLWLARLLALMASGAGVVLVACGFSDRVNPALSVTGGTLLVLLLGELAPSWLGHTRPAAAAKALRLPFEALRLLLHFPVRILLGRPPTGGDTSGGEWAFTPPDLMWLEQRRGKGDADDFDQERELMDGIVEFSDRIVREVMVPRIDMVCIELSDDLQAVLAEVLRAGHSRIPVYREKIDQVVGVLYAKDLLRVLAGGGRDFQMERILRQAYFIPEYKKIDDLLREFQSHRIHMAIVVDEYGGTAGLVTMEDILEEVFGEIRDEFDLSEAPQMQSLGMGSYRVDAMLPIDRLNELLDTSFEDDDFATAGGLVYHALGKIPRPGEQVTLEGHTFTVEKVRAQRILLLKITPEDSKSEKPGQ